MDSRNEQNLKESYRFRIRRKCGEKICWTSTNKKRGFAFSSNLLNKKFLRSSPLILASSFPYRFINNKQLMSLEALSNVASLQEPLDSKSCSDGSDSSDSSAHPTPLTLPSQPPMNHSKPIQNQIPIVPVVHRQQSVR